MQEKLMVTYGTAILSLGNTVLFHEGPSTVLGQSTEGHPFVNTQGVILSESAQLVSARSEHESKLRGVVRRMHAAGVEVKSKLLAKQGITWDKKQESQYLVPLLYEGPYGAESDGAEEEQGGEAGDEVVEEVAEEEEGSHGGEEEVERLDTSDEEDEVVVVEPPQVSEKRQRVLEKRAKHFGRAQGGRLAAKRSNKNR
ncbi:hypothetical protein CYMTET_43784 [Cymbomonas tetramitiformis]|uniref:Uncharacterized protein n=1 Tax=Cymbomonas tetramitiformis TaxID=36881 RepID=A0AAE0C2M0_9CHLO|nr:hypothetical protein CYMTET_43784 [Cymbomonas tetramitiformis]